MGIFTTSQLPGEKHSKSAIKIKLAFTENEGMGMHISIS